MSEIFDKRFVHFMWDDELKGKRCFVSDGIDELRVTVEKAGEYDLRTVIFSRDESAPFKTVDGLYAWKFAYYDPNYEVKKAFNEGKKVQVKRIDSFVDWVDCDEPIWSKECNYRIKPEEEKRYRPYENSAEMIADFIDRFKVNCPPYCEPLIWVRNKNKKDERQLVYCFMDLIIKMDNTYWDMNDLFYRWTYLDGSPVGMVED
jgi:hypothetical protein